MAEPSAATIDRFRKMTEADPTNELGHFSLGKEYLDAGRFDEAAASFRRVLELNANMGKAYQLLGAALLRQNRREEAIAQLTQGMKVAQARADAKLKSDIVAMLTELGAPVPADAPSAAAQAVGESEVLCKRCGRVAPRMPRPPMNNAFGREVQANICADCWKQAIGHGTKVINELRLPLNDPQAGKIWDQHVREFLNLSQG